MTEVHDRVDDDSCAACSCGWRGPERPDAKWRNADWFGHEVEYETAELNEMAPEREGGAPRTTFYPDPVLVPPFVAPAPRADLPRSLSEISFDVTTPLWPEGTGAFLGAVSRPAPEPTLEVAWVEPRPCPACGEPATGFHAVVDHTRQTSLDLDGFAGMEITMRAVRFEPCGCPQDRAVVERPGAYHVGVGLAHRVEDCGTECQAPAEAPTVQAVRFDTVPFGPTRGTTC